MFEIFHLKKERENKQGGKRKRPHCMRLYKIEAASKQEEKHLKMQGNDVIRGDQSLGKINFKTSAAFGDRWQERRTFRARHPGFKSISAT